MRHSKAQKTTTYICIHYFIRNNHLMIIGFFLNHVHVRKRLSKATACTYADMFRQTKTSFQEYFFFAWVVVQRQGFFSAFLSVFRQRSEWNCCRVVKATKGLFSSCQMLILKFDSSVRKAKIRRRRWSRMNLFFASTDVSIFSRRFVAFLMAKVFLKSQF
jgi:hypothetical protein